MRRSRALAPALARALPRRQLALGVAATFAIVWLLDHATSEQAIVPLQAGALTLSLTVATILDDAAAETAGATPSTLLARRSLTLALAFPILALAWVTLTFIGSDGLTQVGALTLQLAALVLATLALAVVLPAGSQIAGALVVLVFLTMLTGAHASVGALNWALVPRPGDAGWIATWAGLTATAAAALLYASRDPARPRRAQARTS